MSLSTTLSDGVLTIELGEKFDFESVEEFRAAYAEKGARSYVVDFRNTEYMDSSGLGMLLNMKRSLGDDAVNIKLKNCRAQIKKVLTISRFETKFEIF